MGRPDRIAFQEPVPGYPFQVVLSRSRAALLAPWRESRARILGAGLLIELAAGALAFLLFWQLRKREGTERELIASRTLLQSVFDTIPYSLLVKDRGGRILLANAAAARAARLSNAEIVGTVLHEWSGIGPIPDQERSAILDSDRQAYESGKSVELEFWRTFPAGKRMVRVVKAPFVDAAGEVGGLVTLTEDITDRVHMQEDLQSSRQLLQAVFDTIPLVLVVKDVESRYLMVNRTWEKVFGMSASEVLGKRPDEVPGRPEEEAHRLLDSDRRLFGLSVESFDTESDLTNAAGEKRLFKSRGSLLRDASGTITGMVTASMDITDARMAEDGYRLTQSRLQDAIETMPAGFLLYDAQERLITWNSYVVEYFAGIRDVLRRGATFEEIVRHSATFTEDAKGREEEWVQQQLAHFRNHVGQRFEQRLEDGRWLQGVYRRTSEGGTVSLRMDITPIKTNEAAVRESQQLLQTVFDTIPVGVVVKDLEGRHVLANKFVSEMVEASQEQLLATRSDENAWGRPITPEEQALIRETDARSFKGETVEFEFERVLMRGPRRLRTIKVPLKDAQGQVTGILVVTEDITNRRHAEDELRGSRALLQTVFDTIPHHLFAKDREGRFLMVNRSLAAAFGRSPEEYGGKHLAEVRSAYLPGNVPEVDLEDLRVVAEGESVDRSLLGTMPDGTDRYFHLTKAPMRDDTGRITGLLGLAEDITERVVGERKRAELESQLQQAQKMDVIGRLAAGVAHDFNNLLTPIMGYSEIGLGETPPGHPLRTPFEVILQAATRAGDLTRELLAFGRKQVLEMRELDLGKEVASMVQMANRIVGSHIEIRTAVNPSVGPVHGDAGQIHQVLMNLIVNARDAMSGGGTLTIAAEPLMREASDPDSLPGMQPGPYVRLSVTDTGTGMDADTQARIFEPFFTTKDVGKGTGLGLSIVYGIVRQHGGQIRVRSAPGAGTTFEIDLPLAQQPAPSAVERKPEAISTRGAERVLVVDDEAMVRTLMVNVLTSQGYTVLEAADPQAALHLMDSAGSNGHAQVDLLVTDFVMPKSNGFELYQHLVQHLPSLKVLYVSGHPQELLDRLGTDAANQPLLRKPFGVGKLAEKVREILDG